MTKKNMHKVLFSIFVFIFVVGIGSISIAGYFDKTILQRVINTVTKEITGNEEAKTASEETSAVPTTSNTNSTSSTSSTSAGSGSATAPSTNTTTPTPSGITAAQLAAHNTASNCWVVVSGTVYNASGFNHPAAQSLIRCGTDITSAYSGVSKHASIGSYIPTIGAYAG